MTEREAKRAAYRDVPETCPIIDKAARNVIDTIEREIIAEQGTISSSLSHDIEYAVNSLIDVVKQQTNLFRAALIEAHELRISMEASFDYVNNDLFDAKRQIDYLEEEIVKVYS